MKKKYLYIILSIVCLFGFNNEVKALTCQYNKKDDLSKPIIYNSTSNGYNVTFKGNSIASDKALIYEYNTESKEFVKLSSMSECFSYVWVSKGVNTKSDNTVYIFTNLDVSLITGTIKGEWNKILNSNNALHDFEINAVYTIYNQTVVNVDSCSGYDWETELANTKSNYESKFSSDFATCIYAYSDDSILKCQVIKYLYDLDDNGSVNQLYYEIPSQVNNGILQPDQITLTDLLFGQCYPNLYYQELFTAGIYVGQGVGYQGDTVTRVLSYEKGAFSGYNNAYLRASDPLNGSFYIEGVVIKTCEDLIPEALRDKINEYLTWVKVLVPIIIIGLGVVDFIQAILASDETDMKKAQKKLITRLIIGIIIFLIPTILNLLLDLANMAWSSIGTGTCGIG